MVRKFIIITLFVGLALIVAPSSFAVEQTQRWVCLNAVRCSEPNSNCSGKGALAHRVKLTARTDIKPAGTSDTHIYECVATDGGQICTNGKDAQAQQLAAKGYSFEGFFKADGQTASPNPIKSATSGDIGTLEWQSFSSRGLERKFLAFNYITENNIGGNQGGTQQSTFEFETALKKCLVVRWDPYGRVFDSQTLEPVPSATVSLLKKRTDGQFTIVTSSEVLGGIVNPQGTVEDGYFSFLVPDGIYKLNVAASQYVFPGTVASLPANYSKIYSDIYPLQTPEEIVQQGQIQHRDIPIDTNSPGKTYPVKLMEYFQELNKATGQVIVEGQTSHPFTSIRAYSQKKNVNDRSVRSKLVETTQADKEGKFKLVIAQAKFDTDEFFGEVEIEKRSLIGTLSKNSFFETIFKAVNAQDVEAATIRFEPIPTYLEGYAYNASSQPIPNATVAVYLAYADTPYYTTAADNKGFFKISSEYLPFMPYKLRYTSSTGSVDSSTSKFVNKNADYLVKNNVNLNIPRDKTGKIISVNAQDTTVSPASSTPFGKSQPRVNDEKKIADNDAPPPVSTNSTMYLFVAVALVFLAVVGLMLGLYLYRKSHTPSPESFG